jgi:phosphatidate cytidylyltransferase
VSNLWRRVVSAAVLAPVALGSAYLGGWGFLAVCTAVAVGILWEWTGLVSDSFDVRILAPGLGALLVAVILTSLNEPVAAIAVVTIGAAVAGGVVALWQRPGRGDTAPSWAATGVIYSGIAFFGPALLRRDPELGFAALVFLAASVWATDICAYAVGRVVGGPLLWRQVSPNKTWSGAVGGLVGGVAAGVGVAYANGFGRPAVLGIIALLLSVLTQAGDLFESAVKRRFGAKDASQLIPGHGGLMDRLDGFLVAALAALLIGVLRQGTDAPAQGLLIW